MKESNIITRRDASKLLSIGASSLLFNPLIKSQNDKMNKREVSKSGEMLPVVGLGTWQTFDVGSSSRERDPLKEVVNILLEHGGSVIDSSPMYGRSEKVIGEITSELSQKNQLFEATKVWTSGKEKGINQMNESMRLMKVSKMDLMQIHNLLDWKTHMKTLRKWREESKIRYIGITHYHSGAYDEMKKIMSSEDIDFIQINYNLAVRDAADTILPLARDKGIAVLINRPYQGGSLFQKVKNKTLPEWASEFDAKTWGQFFLKFILSHPAVNCVIPGTARPEHMKDNIRAGFGSLPDTSHRQKMIDFINS